MNLRRRLAVLITSAALALSSVGATVAPVAAHGGICSHSNTSNHVYVRRIIDTAGFPATSGSYFDWVQGAATVTSPPVCIGGLGDGGTAVLPANVERSSNGYVFQLGYVKASGLGGPQFAWAGQSPQEHLISSPLPVPGNVYKFVIYRRTSGYVSYEIWSGSTNIWRFDSTFSLGTADIAWWGYETQDYPESVHDGTPTSGRAAMHNMQYSTDTHSTVTTLTDLACSGGTPFDANIHKNFGWDGSPSIGNGFFNPCLGSRGAYTGTYAFNGDMLDVWTTD